MRLRYKVASIVWVMFIAANLLGAEKPYDFHRMDRSADLGHLNSTLDDIYALLSDNVTLFNAVMPVGSYWTFATATAPSGYHLLRCDGTAVSRTTYAALFAVIGTTHGQGDGSTTFNLPDTRGRFERDLDGTANRDPNDPTRTAMNTGGNTGDNVGSVQGDTMQGHKHAGAQLPTYANGSVSLGENLWVNGNGGAYGTINAVILSPTSDGINGTPRTGSETRPTNYTSVKFIKY